MIFMSIHLLMSKRARKTVIQKLRFKHLFEKYVTYMEETTDTSNGKTTECWINYAYLTDIYLILNRARKMNDTQLFASLFY